MSLRTVLIDAQNDLTNRRSELRLDPNQLYLSNIKICDLGFTSPNSNNDNFNHSAGILAVIKNIYLYDGSQILDSRSKFNLYQAFKNYNQSSVDEMDKDKTLKGTLLSKTVTGLHKVNTAFTNYSACKPTNDNTTPKFMLDLSECFDILKQLKYIHTGFFKNFRIVIEYEDDVNLLLDDFDPTPPTINTVRPFLYCNVIEDNGEMATQWLKTFAGVQYDSIENDMVRVDTINVSNAQQSLIQNNNYQFNGFNGKFMKKLLISKNATDYGRNNAGEVIKCSKYYKRLGSEAQFQERFQVRVNGSNLFPRNGIIGPNERLRLLNDTWGTCCTWTGANTPLFVDSQNYFENLTPVGHLDYFGCNVAQKISDLQIEYQRTGVFDSTVPTLSNGQFTQPLDLNLFGVITKQLLRMGDTYMISYV